MKIYHVICVFIMFVFVGCKTWWGNEDKPIIRNSYQETQKVINVDNETKSIRQNSNDLIKVSTEAKTNSKDLTTVKPELLKVQEYLKLDANVEDICKIGTELKINADNLEIKKNVINEFATQVVKDINTYTVENIQLLQQIEELKKEIQKVKDDKNHWVFSLMIGIGALITGLGVFVALQGNPKIGWAGALAGITFTSVGLMFRETAVYLPWIAGSILIFGIVYIIRNKNTAITEITEGYERLKPKMTEEFRSLAKEIMGAVQSKSTVEIVNPIRQQIVKNITNFKTDNPVSLDKV